jgi:hypothetical protein
MWERLPCFADYSAKSSTIKLPHLEKLSYLGCSGRTFVTLLRDVVLASDSSILDGMTSRNLTFSDPEANGLGVDPFFLR